MTWPVIVDVALSRLSVSRRGAAGNSAAENSYSFVEGNAYELIDLPNELRSYRWLNVLYCAFYFARVVVFSFVGRAQNY